MGFRPLVVVHLGAGYHSASSESRYQEIIREVCKAALKIVNEQGSSIDGVCEAMRLLENCPFTNAGIGSNLNINGKTECDASIMDASSFGFGAVGAVSGIKNPILVAKKILLQQNQGLLELGRIPPCLLVGEGAREFALENNCELIVDSDIAPKETRRMYTKSKRMLEKSKLHRNMNSKKPCTETNNVQTSISPDPGQEFKLDTVGAICIDKNGNISSAVSSGGLLLKHSGRIGQASCFGAGCWAQNIDNISVAVTTSGVGEYLIRTTFAKQCALRLMDDNNPLSSAKKALKQDFVQSPFLKKHERKLAGSLMIKFDRENGHCDLIIGHTTSSFCYGYMKGNNRKSVTKISRLKDENSSNQEIRIEAMSIKLK